MANLIFVDGNFLTCRQESTGLCFDADSMRQSGKRMVTVTIEYFGLAQYVAKKQPPRAVTQVLQHMKAGRLAKLRVSIKVPPDGMIFEQLCHKLIKSL